MSKRCYAGCRGECRCYPDDPPAEEPIRQEEPQPAERHAWDDLFDELDRERS